MSARMQPGSSLLPKQTVDVPRRDPSPVLGSVQLHGDILPQGSQDVPTESKEHLTQLRSSESVKYPKPLLQSPEHLLKAPLLQEPPTLIQALVRGDTVEARQEAEWTVISATPPHGQQPSEQVALERYKRSSLVFQSQLQTNKQFLGKFGPDPVTNSTLHNQKKQLEQTEELWLDLELQFSQLSQSSFLLTREDLGDVERDRKQLSLEWRGQQMCLQSRMVSLEEQMHRIDEVNVEEVCEKRTGHDSLQYEAAQEQEKPPSRAVEEEAPVEANRSRLNEEDTDHTCRSEGDVKDQRRGGLIQDKREKVNLDERRVSLLITLREIKVASEQLGLQEPTLPALQHRACVLTEFESHLSGLVTELRHLQDASETPDVSPTQEAENLWEETTKAVTERLEQCSILTELLKKFQSIRCDLSGVLQRAESTMSKQASYMGKDNLQRIRSKVQGTKAELNGLGENVEEVRSVCRQLDTHLRHIPECTVIPFESEADGLMDQWLDISERIDSHLDNLHTGLNLWDGVLRLGADVEIWTANKLAVFAECPSFQSECDISALQNEIVAQEESIEHYHRRVTEIQSLLQTAEIPLELQMVESQMKQKIEQLKKLVCEAEEVYMQVVAAKGQITIRLNSCFDSLHKIQDSLLTLSGSDVATVLAKDIRWQLQTQEEQAESLLEDLRVMASVASPDSLQNLSAEGFRVQETVRNTHQIFSEVQEHIEEDIQDLDRVRAELLSRPVSCLQKSALLQATPVDGSRFGGFSTNILSVTTDKQASPKRNTEVFQARHPRQPVDSAFGEHLGIQSVVEQKLHRAQEVVGATAEAQDRLEELGAVRNRLTQRLCDREASRQESIQAAGHQCRGLLQPAEPYYRILQADPESTSCYLAQKLEPHSRVEELECQIAQLLTLFPVPGTAELRQVCLLACQLRTEAKSLQFTLAALAQHRRERAEKIGDTTSKDASWAKLDDYWSGVVAELKGVCSCLEEGVSNEEYFGQLLQDCHHKLASLQERMSARQAQKESSVGPLTDLPAQEASLQEVTDTDDNILQPAAPGDSIAASSTAASQQVGNLRNHKGAVESSVRASLADLSVHHQRVQHVKEEVSCVQTELKDLADNVRKSCGNQEELPDINHLKLQWRTIQVSDTRVTELAARVDLLQRFGQLRTEQEMIPADVILTLDAVSKDLNSLGIISLQKKQECTESTASWMRRVIDQLHQWSQTAQTEPFSPSQAFLDEGLLHQQSVCELLSERDFLLNCLGSEISKKVEERALDALSESTSALEVLSKHRAIGGHRAAESENGEFEDQTDHKARNTGTFSATLQESQPSTGLGTNTNLAADATKRDQTCMSVEHADMAITCADRFMQPAWVPKGVLSAGIPNVLESKTQENTEQLDDDTTSINGTDNDKEIRPAAPVGSPLWKPGSFHLSAERPAAQPEAFQMINKAHKPEKHSEGISVTPKNVVTIVLNMEPQDMQRSENVGPGLPACRVSDADAVTQACSVDYSQKKSTLTSLKNLNVTAQCELSGEGTDAEGNECEDPSVRPKKVFAIVLELKPQDVLQRENVGAGTSDSSRCSARAEPCNEKVRGSEELVSECQLSGASAAQTNFPDVSREEVTDFCRHAEPTASSVWCPVHTGSASTEAQRAANPAQSAGMGLAQRAEEGSDRQGPKPEGSGVPERRDDVLLKDGSKSKFPWWLSQRRLVIQGSMEPERTAQGSSAHLGAVETKTRKHKSAMWDILCGIQGAVERSNVINRAAPIDLKWYLQSTPGELEIRLIRSVQQVLASRYQPAQLDIRSMAKQLKEAEEYSRRVQERVDAMKSWTAARVCDPAVLKSAEQQWSAALLDTSATVQVKVAQLDQVKQYHKHMKMTRAFLEVLAAEKEKMSLDALGSSAVQADQLHALMQTMKQKKRTIGELRRLSSQLSVHLSVAESSGVLLAWLGDVQEEWRCLEGSIKRALQHASNSTSQFSFLMKEAKRLKAKLEALQKSNYQSSDSKSDLELVCLTTDLKLYNQLNLQLKSQSDALVHFSLGQKETDEIQNSLQELESLLNVTKRKVDVSTYSCGSSSSLKVSKQLRDLIVWAKQAEYHISVGKTLALFPEEARIQIAEMQKFQTDILSRRSKMQAQVEEMKALTTDTRGESDQLMNTIEDLYEAIADSLDQVLDTMKKNLQEREKLLHQLASVDAWLSEAHAAREPRRHVARVSKADVKLLEGELQRHQSSIVEMESQLSVVEAMADICKDIAAGLIPGESRYLVNRLSGLWAELDGLLAHEKATSWELEELIQEQAASDMELSAIQANLKLIASDLEHHRFSLSQDTLSAIACVKHMLTEHQCQVQELQHCQDGERGSLLASIGELQDRCKALRAVACEQQKYLHLRRQLEESVDIMKGQTQRAKDEALSVDERFTLCQALLVQLPMVKTQCQDARDQLEAIAQELNPSEFHPERQRVDRTVKTLVSWEHSVTEEIKNLEAMLLPRLRFASEHHALIEFFQGTRAELGRAKPLSPDHKAIDGALQRYWLLWRNMESGMRVLDALGQKEEINLRNYEHLYSLRDATMQECHLQLENLSQARESLKDYQWAARGAIGFVHDAEATFLSAPGGFLDCAEEHRQTQQALEALEAGFQAHISHVGELVPRQPCLSRPEIQQIHISVLSQLLVGRALLEAQAQLRLECLQRCTVRQQTHSMCHEELQQHLSGFEARLSECAATRVTSYDKCVAQRQTAMLLMEDLHSLARKMEELKAQCPNQGCGAGKDGERGALWRRWVSSRQDLGLLVAHIGQRRAEWKDIIISMEQRCSFLASFQAEVQDSSSVSFTHDEPQELLAHAEMLHAGMEQEQQVLASVEHRLEHALSSSTSQGPVMPGTVGKTLMKIQQNIGSLKERNLLLVAAAQEEEKHRQKIQEELGELEKHILAALAACSNPSKQDLQNDLSSQKTKLRFVTEDARSRYAVIPADIGRRLQEVQLSLQRAEEKLAVSSSLVQKLAGRVVELVAGLEMVKALLEQRSPTVGEAQNVLKHVWDKLDIWHSRLMLLESDVQDLAEEQPDHAHVLMDQLTQPLQLHQNTAQMAEQRTSFLSKIPACLQEFEDILFSATCWLDEAQTWLNTRCAFTTARSFQNHANSLQLVLDDSARIRDALRDFRSVLAEISAVCDISTEQEKLEQNDQQVQKMQCNILEPLEQLLQAAEVVEAVEAELKTMEKNIPKIRAILSSMENSNIALTEHLQNRQVILDNVQSMRRTLEEMEKCRGELRLPQGGEENLTAFTRAKLLLQQLEELKQVTRQQASLLESKISDEEGTSSNPALTTIYKEAFELSISEEEEDEDDGSCHSSSSDTLTCSIPEDPEEEVDVQYEATAEMKPRSDLKDPNTSPPTFASDVETSSEGAEAGLGFDTRACGPKTMDSKAEVVEAFSLEPAPVEALIPADAPAAEGRFPAAESVEQHEALASDPPTKSLLETSAFQSKRLIPPGPITPFAAATSLMFIEGGDEGLTTVPKKDVGVASGLREQLEGSTGCSSLDESSEASISLAGPDDGREGQSWGQLYALISQKLTTLKTVHEEHQTQASAKDGIPCKKAPQRELLPSEHLSTVLQQAHKSIAMLRQTVKSARSSHPGVEEELYEAVRSVLLCTDTWTDVVSGEDDPQLRLLQQECLAADLGTLAELLRKTESVIQSVLAREEPDALRCVTCLQDCVRTVWPAFTSSHNQLIEDRSLTKYRELSSKQLCILDMFDLGKSEMFPSLKNAPSLEQCVLGRHLRERPGENARLQQASRSLLQGIIHLLDLGEECKTEVQMSQVHSRSQLQAILCGRKNLLQVVRSQLAFVQHLFEREPEALKCQEDERVLLEIRAKALQQEALQQEVVLQTRLQEWSRWEDNCGQLGRVLDDLEAFISNGEPERDDEKLITQHRLDACQRALVQLDESGAALGLLQDQRSALLQTEPALALSVSWAGGALELRWRSAYRRTQQEVRRCRDVLDSWTRFQTDFGSLSEWLVGANKHLKTLSDLANTSDLNQEGIHGHLIGLLDFTKEMEAMSMLKAAVSREGTKLIYLKEADSPMAQLAQLDVSWSQLTSDLSKIQDQLQQRLVSEWPPEALLSHLEDWLKKQETLLNREKETVLKAEDAPHISEILQHIKELKAGVVSGQSLLDFLCQSGPQVLGGDVQTLGFKSTVFAETLGALRLRWMDFEREVQSQICKVERIHHTCAAREKRLKHFYGLTVQHKEQLNRWQLLTSRTLLRKALEEWEVAEARLKDVAAALQELKATRAHLDEEEARPCDVAFCFQAERIISACGDLCEEMASLRPALERASADWLCYEGALKEVCLRGTRARCALQHPPAPLFSLKQAEGRLLVLQQQLEEKAAKGERLWASVERSRRSLVKSLHRGTTRALSEEEERERKRWEDIAQETRAERAQTAATASLWQEHGRLSELCCRRLQSLRRRWEELSPERSTQAALHAVQELQGDAEDLQRSVGDVLAASRPLMGRLQPLAANVIQSETGLVSRDVLLLSRAIAQKEKSLQEHLEKEKRFLARLEAADMQMQSIAGCGEADSAQVLSELGRLLSSLVDVEDTSRCAAERLQVLSREWTESLTRTCDMNRELQAERLTSQSFEDKCRNLASLREKLEQEAAPGEARRYSSIQEMLTAQQRRQAEVAAGHQLLHSLLCDAVSALGKETGGKRSELVARVSSVKQRWSDAVALTDRCRSWMAEQLQLWRTYREGSELVWKLLTDVEVLLPEGGLAPRALLQPHGCMDDHQCVTEAVRLHSAVYTQTLAAGRRLHETVSESESRRRLQSECRATEAAWERTTSLLRSRSGRADAAVHMWSRCQDGLSDIIPELRELETSLQRRPEGSEEDSLVREAELSLQRLDCGLRRLDAMKTELCRHVAPGDSALLEQQLGRLQAQWEELCTKVSLRRQEMADRLSAWTIFSDNNKEFCDWLTQMEDKVCGGGGPLSVEEMVEKLKKDCVEEMSLFSESKSRLIHLGEQLLAASGEATQTRVHGSLREVDQRWNSLCHHVEARVTKLKETLVTVQQLDKDMSSLHSWLSRIEADLSRPVTYSVCQQQEIQKRLAEQQGLQQDIEQHTEGVASVLSLCDALLRDGDAELESESLQETSRSLDQRWRSICAVALDRKLRIEETWRLWCKFLEDYSRFEDWLKMAERAAASPNSADVLYTVAKEELKKFEGFQRQVHERLTQLELVNNQYRRLARENRADRASRLKAMVHEGNRRWDALQRRVAAVLRRLKHFTSQREDFESTRENLLMWLTELDLQLTNVEHFSESDVHQKMQRLNSFQKEITLNTERIDGLIVFGEALIQRSSAQDAALIEDELEQLHSYCQEVFSRLVRFHQRLSQPQVVTEEPRVSGTVFAVESSLELICRPWLGRRPGSLPATPVHLLERPGWETPLSVESLPLEWDPSGDVGRSSSHDDDEEEEGANFSALAVVPESSVSSTQQQSYLSLTSQCSGRLENIRRVSLILEEQPLELGLRGLTAADTRSGVIERWELLQAQPTSDQQADQLTSDLHKLQLWLEDVLPRLQHLLQSDPASSIADMEAKAKELKDMQNVFTRFKSVMLSANLRARAAPSLQQELTRTTHVWSQACAGLQQWDTVLRDTLMRCREFHETLHSLLLWLAHAESRRHAVDVGHASTPVRALQQHRNTLTALREELRGRRAQQASLQALWSQLQPQDRTEESGEAQEKLHVTGSKLKLLLQDVDRDLSRLQRRLDREAASHTQPPRDSSTDATHSTRGSTTLRARRGEPSPPPFFFRRVLRAAFPLLLLLLLLPCLIPLAESEPGCTVTNNFAWSFYPMLRYTNGPPPT